MALRAVGYGARLIPTRGVQPQVRANRAVFRRAGLDEWYRNGPLGIEQGFTLFRRLRPAGRGPLTFELGLPPGARASLAEDARSAVLERGGAQLLRYSGLSASDALGRPLRTWLHAGDGQLLVRVDDRGARYPVRVDPVVGAAKLTAATGASEDVFGSSVAISSDGSTVVVGASGVSGGTGAAYVFVRPGGGWADAHETAELTASDGVARDRFGSSVAASSNGSTIAVGADEAHHSGNSNGPGAVYVFTSPNGWSSSTQAAKLTASDGAAYDGLGAGVGVSGDGTMVVAGAPNNGFNTVTQTYGAGAAYVFATTNGWASHSQTKLTTGGSGDQMGASVSTSSDGSAVAVGAPQGLTTTGHGVAYVFVQSSGNWSGPVTLTASDGANGDELGDSIAISGDGSTLVAGAPGAAAGAGAAYVFIKQTVILNMVISTIWKSYNGGAKLTASDGDAGGLGSSVAISNSGYMAVAGSPGSIGGEGAAYVFTQSVRLGQLRWISTTQRTRVTASDGAPADPENLFPGDTLGSSVALYPDGTGIVAGAPYNTNYAGAAYVFRHPTSTAVGCQPATVPGEPSTCTATVQDIVSSSTTPTGSVSFSSDSGGSFGGGGSCTLAASATAGIASCQLSYTPSSVGSGTHKLTGSYEADSVHAGSRGTTSLTVTPAPSATAVACRPSDVVVRSSSVCTATVQDTGSHHLTPTGSVRFTSSAGGSFSAGGSCTLATKPSGVASCHLSYTPAVVGSGTHKITAAFGGDGGHSGSQAASPITVRPASTATAVGCRPLSTFVAHAARCTATVTDTATGPGSTSPTGNVHFTTNAAGSFGHGGSCTLVPTATAGVASCQLPYTPSGVGAGTHKITANYGGDPNHAPSHGAALVAVKALLPKVSIASGPLTDVNGLVRITLSCPAAETFCTGTLSLKTAHKFQASGKPRRLLLARARPDLAGGAIKPIAIPLIKRMLKVLGTRSTVSVTVTVVAHDQAGRTATSKRSTKLVLL